MAIAAPLQAREIKMTAQTVREISASAFTDAIEMLAIIEVLEAGNQKPVIKGVNDAGAGRAGEHIKRALFTRLHFLVARCYGKTRRKDRHARKAFEILKDPKIAAEMQNSADLKTPSQCGRPVATTTDSRRLSIFGISFLLIYASLMLRWEHQLTEKFLRWRGRRPLRLRN
jgi:hypothetical protein